MHDKFPFKMGVILAPHSICLDIDYIYKQASLRLERGGRHQISISCACFSITLLCLNIFSHTIHQIKDVYLSYPLVYINLYFV